MPAANDLGLIRQLTFWVEFRLQKWVVVVWVFASSVVVPLLLQPLVVAHVLLPPSEVLEVLVDLLFLLCLLVWMLLW